MQTIVFTGDFTTAELKELADCMRVIERRRPNDTFHMIVEDKAEKLGAEIVNHIFPAVQGTPVTTKTWNQ